LVSTARIVDYLSWSELAAGRGKEDEYSWPSVAGLPININGQQLPYFVGWFLKKFIKDGDKIEVPTNFNMEELDHIRSAATAASIINDINADGQGILVPELKTKFGV